MALATALPTLPSWFLRLSDGERVRILNPMPGGERFTSAKRARRFVASKRAHVGPGRYLVFEGRSKAAGRVGVGDRLVDGFSGVDAKPGRAVYPPSPEVLARMGSRGRAVLPPMGGR